MVFKNPRSKEVRFICVCAVRSAQGEVEVLANFQHYNRNGERYNLLGRLKSKTGYGYLANIHNHLFFIHETKSLLIIKIPVLQS